MSVFLQADPINRQIEDITRYQEQKKIYEEQTKERQSAKPIYTPLGRTALHEDVTESKRCIPIETIELEEITLIEKELDTLIQPYLHRCNTMNEINNLVKKINNLPQRL
ncbi:POTRA domain-containing protein [Sulfurovum sp.]|uniref:POTRA domain-containing protein n=1 Tax=Sulfurovum sp. TaxID=1969726 RepID=UPI002A364371|nr:POTRA domain-containing protein [Sulfurovum sp.]MDY0403160.1 POTRA domain-containing protein [Sulfurovum sp.]